MKLCNVSAMTLQMYTQQESSVVLLHDSGYRVCNRAVTESQSKHPDVHKAFHNLSFAQLLSRYRNKHSLENSLVLTKPTRSSVSNAIRVQGLYPTNHFSKAGTAAAAAAVVRCTSTNHSCWVRGPVSLLPLQKTTPCASCAVEAMFWAVL